MSVTSVITSATRSAGSVSCSPSKQVWLRPEGDSAQGSISLRHVASLRQRRWDRR